MPGDGGVWPFRVVADTNVYLSAVHPDAANRADGSGYQASPSEEFILRAVGRDFVLLFSLSGFLELTEKLEDLNVPVDLAKQLLAGLRSIAEEVQTHTSTAVCDDPDDDKFVWAELDGAASHLVTADRALTRASEPLQFRVMRVVTFLRELRDALKVRGISGTKVTG